MGERPIPSRRALLTSSGLRDSLRAIPYLTHEPGPGHQNLPSEAVVTHDPHSIMNGEGPQGQKLFTDEDIAEVTPPVWEPSLPSDVLPPSRRNI